MLNNVVVSVENGQIVIFFQVQLTIARNQQLRHRSTCKKKISKHARSKAHLTATKVLKEQQNRQIQSSTGLSVAQHQCRKACPSLVAGKTEPVRRQDFGCYSNAERGEYVFCILVKLVDFKHFFTNL